ncbi:MAG TPA: condensation domain-containing protein, partial [Longimicrobium sp.]|nr:condensation domain-containing protein [Longimicrobium sp.]
MSGNDTLARRAGLTEAQRALLEKRLRGKAPSTAPADVIPPAAHPGPEYPASFAQERMWFFQNFQPGNPMYNVPLAVTMSAEVKPDVLAAALTDLVRRHEALRTVFRMGADGELKQVVLPPHPVPVEVRDVRDRVYEETQARDIQKVVAEEAARPIDLENGPMVRCALLRVTDDRFARVLTVHHIATDGWAYPVILREIGEVYTAFLEGRPSPYPDTQKLRYVDYAVWLRDQLRGEKLAKQLDFWRGHLDGVPPTELPGDRPRPRQISYRGAIHHFRGDLETVEALRVIAREESATMNAVLTAVFYALVMKYTGQGDLVAGTLAGNRTRAELEGVIGLFMNTIALRLDISDDPTFREAVRRARSATVGALDHQDFPFEKLVDELDLPRDLSRHPVFQLLYFHHTFVQSHRVTEKSGGMTALGVRSVYEGHTTSLVDTGVSKFDLMLATSERPWGLEGLCEYSTDLFDEATAARFSRQFCTLATACAANPDLPISRLSALDAEERAQVVAWGMGAALETEVLSIHRRIEEQAARRPDAVAVEAADGRLTFAELDAWASRVAAELAARGLGRGDVVAVCVERSTTLVATLLGVLKSGAGYLPLDPAYPEDRIAYMLDDAGASLVLTTPASRGALPESAAEVVAVPDRPSTEDPFAAAPGAEVDAGELAYLIYTSGSTGKPKAVELTHGNAASYLDSVRAEFGLGEGDAVLGVASVSHDLSVFELLLSPAAGARVVVASADDAIDPRAIGRLLEAHGVTALQATPSTWRMLVAAGWEG